jgi:5-methylcytosine-specific restriction endonuclease McrA
MFSLLSTRTLLLDASFRALRAIRWQRAIVLDLSGRVDVLEYYDREIHSTTRSYPLPAVIRLRRYLKFFPLKVALTRRNILARDGFSCHYCGSHPPLKELTMDHVMPRSRGGKTSWENVVTACGTCNRKKGNRTPREARMPILSRPKRPSFVTAGKDILVGDPPVLWRDYLPLPAVVAPG